MSKWLVTMVILSPQDLGLCYSPSKWDPVSFMVYKWGLYIGYCPLPLTVTTRIITFLVGNPYKPSFATVTGRGHHPSYILTTYIHPGIPSSKEVALHQGIPDSKTLPIEVHRDSMDEECSHTSTTKRQWLVGFFTPPKTNKRQ